MRLQILVLLVEEAESLYRKGRSRAGMARAPVDEGNVRVHVAALRKASAMARLVSATSRPTSDVGIASLLQSRRSS